MTDDAPLTAQPLFVPGPEGAPVYGSGAFFPMPVMIAVTEDAAGQLNAAPYSLVFPQPLEGERKVLLVARRDSNTWRNVQVTGRVSLCFLPDDPGFVQDCVALSRAEDSKSKMARCAFGIDRWEGWPVVVEAEQVLVCALESASEDEQLHERRMLLRVEQVLLKPRWARALRRGFGAPKLAVEFGYRGKATGWMARPQVRFGGPALRPTFEMDVRMTQEEALVAIQRALDSGAAGVEGFARPGHAQINIPAEDAHFWSPELQIRFDETEGKLRVHGRIGPHSRVWTMFMAAHAAVAISAGFGALFGLSQWWLDQPAWGLWAIPAALGLHAFIAGAAFIGQGLGAEHTFVLRAFVEDALTH